MDGLRRKRASLKDVARLASTSIATASRVLNNTGYIAEETREKVLQAAERLDYQPNLRAKGLRQQRSHTIGLLIPNLLNAYYTAFADVISQLLNGHGYQLLLSSTRDDPDIEKVTLRQLIGHDVDGLIWVPTAGDARLVDSLIKQRIPAVSVVRKVEGNRLDTIVFEDFAGAQAATRHLLQLGHRRIGYVGGDICHSSNYERWQGFLAAMKEAGVQVDQRLVKLGAVRSSWGAAATEDLLRLPQAPTAIFCASNALMAGVMRTLQQFAVKIPKAVSLICFDDLDWFSFSNPPISAVATSHERIAKAAVDLLIHRIGHPEDVGKKPAFLQISFELNLRGSTAPPFN
jgi:DNA-binding LacI/PurR family transcriptional regulator